MKKIIFLIALFTAIVNNAYQQSPRDYGKDSLPGCQAVFAYYYNDSIRTFAEAYPYQFNDYSIGDVVDWSWDFGDGAASKEKDPLHFFKYAGDTVKVCLTITTSNNYCTNTSCKTFVVSSPGMPQECYARTSFEVETMESYPPQYHFIPRTSDSIEWYYWDFGDGQQTWEISPVHTYKYSGYYTVCLITKTPEGCKSEACITRYYTGDSRQCQAAWEKYPAPEKGTSRDSLPGLCSTCYVFYDYSSGMPVSWHWTFGDGAESFEQNPMHSFSGPGVYTVCLEILTADSCSSTYCDSVYVGIQEPCNLYGMVVDYTGLDGCGLVIQLENGEVLEPQQIIPDFTLKDGQRVILSYTEIPSMSICMVGKIVRIDCIREVSACHAAFWHYALPWVSSLPPLYQFESDSSQQIVSWQWDFGDGTMVNEKSPMHRYAYTGYYTVCLTIYTSDGCSDTYCETSYFEGKDPQPGLCKYKLSLQTEMIIGPVYSCEGNASARLLDDQGNKAEAQSYLWSTGSTECCISGLCTNTEYWVTVTDPDGCSITGSFLYYSSGSVPGDTAWTNWNYEKSGNNFNFNVPEYQGDYSCIWDFGDGTVAEGFNVYHTYAEEGIYLVTVAIYDPGGVLVLRKEFTVNTADATGIVDPSTQDILSVYPVPATDELFIASSLILPQPLTIRVFNTSGQQIMTKNVSDYSGPAAIPLDVSGLPPGAYYGILISDSTGNITFRFIK